MWEYLYTPPCNRYFLLKSLKSSVFIIYKMAKSGIRIYAYMIYSCSDAFHTSYQNLVQSVQTACTVSTIAMYRSETICFGSKEGIIIRERRHALLIKTICFGVN